MLLRNQLNTLLSLMAAGFQTSARTASLSAKLANGEEINRRDIPFSKRLSGHASK
ncbi:hypothetical protein G3R49_08060 [Shewanella sp. WXL01]|uniref:hypothetical protein n=1 Tax=Shewanella sp. WXL01 TaxID=2709721 RepID=UPI001438260C|nr:hypothetical protein [Shewanella sp. WXL01]NKF50524.1 hypothetical protein [Shewanella sp. WXL01]